MPGCPRGVGALEGSLAGPATIGLQVGLGRRTRAGEGIVAGTASIDGRRGLAVLRRLARLGALIRLVLIPGLLNS